MAGSASNHLTGQSIPEVSALGHLITGAESCVIFFLDPIEHRLCPGASVNLSPEFISVLADKERDEQLITRAIEQPEPHPLIHISGNDQFKAVRTRARREGIRTLWLIPWYGYDGSLSGVFVFASRQVFLPGKQALAAATLLTELISAGRTAHGHGPVETDDEHDEGIPYPFTIIGKDARGSKPRMQKDEHGIPVIYNAVTQGNSPVRKRSKRAEPDAVSVLSHELLSPLTLIKGYTATLLQLSDAITEEQSEQYLRGIQAATDRVIRLLENLRDISRLDIAAPNLLLQPTALPDLLRKVVFEIQSQTAEHVIKLHPAKSLPLVNIDRQKIEQVLTNLLTNAVKYSPRGGDIESTIWQARNEREVQEKLGDVPILVYPCLIVTVSDSGIGIPESEQERIFERFYRVNNRLTRATSGAGLGLHICRIIVEAHGGRIWARARIREGSVFNFSIPVS
jgi:signal transduction histidine kinase